MGVALCAFSNFMTEAPIAKVPAGDGNSQV